MVERRKLPDRPRVAFPRSRIVIKRRYFGSPAKAEVDHHHCQAATLVEMLACLSDAGHGHCAVSDRGCTYQTVDDALAVTQSAYRIHYRAEITPKSLAPVLNLLSSRVVLFF